jgi:hypothetical protein
VMAASQDACFGTIVSSVRLNGSKRPPFAELQFASCRNPLCRAYVAKKCGFSVTSMSGNVGK